MEISSKPKNYNSMSPGPQNPPPSYSTVTPEYPTLIVMIAVLAIILIFCFWGAPGVRDYCRRSICCHCPMDEPRESSVEVREEDDEDFVVVTSLNEQGKNGQVPQQTTDPQPQQ